MATPHTCPHGIPRRGPMQTALTRRKEAVRNSAEIRYRRFYSPFPKNLSQHGFIFRPPTTARIYAMLTSKPALHILNRFKLAGAEPTACRP